MLQVVQGGRLAFGKHFKLKTEVSDVCCQGYCYKLKDTVDCKLTIEVAVSKVA